MPTPQSGPTVLNSNLVNVDQEFERDPRYGWITTDVWAGTKAACLGATQSYDPSKYRCRVSKGSGPEYYLRVTRDYLDDGSQTPEVAQETWELPGNEVQIDIFRAPKSLALGNVMLETVKKCKQNIDRSDVTGKAAAITTAAEQILAVARTLSSVPATINTYANNAADLLHLLLQNVTSMDVPQYVLRQRKVIGKNSDQRPYFANAGYVYWKASHFSGYETIPSDIKFDIFLIPAPVLTTDMAAIYKWGWFKHVPQVKQIGGGKDEILQEWKLGLHAQYLYPPLA